MSSLSSGLKFRTDAAEVAGPTACAEAFVHLPPWSVQVKPFIWCTAALLERAPSKIVTIKTALKSCGDLSVCHAEPRFATMPQSTVKVHRQLRSSSHDTNTTPPSRPNPPGGGEKARQGNQPPPTTLEEGRWRNARSTLDTHVLQDTQLRLARRRLARGREEEEEEPRRRPHPPTTPRRTVEEGGGRGRKPRHARQRQLSSTSYYSTQTKPP